MRGVLSRLGIRGLSVVAIILVVLGILAAARLVGDGQRAEPLGPGSQALPTVDPSAGDDGEVIPTLSSGPEDMKVITAARIFTMAWLRRDLSATEWHSRIAPLCTSALAASLGGVDPKSVPATRSTGDPTLKLRTESYAQTVVTVDAGKLTLNLAKQGDRWLVDAVDWDRG